MNFKFQDIYFTAGDFTADIWQVQPTMCLVVRLGGPFISYIRLDFFMTMFINILNGT